MLNLKQNITLCLQLAFVQLTIVEVHKLTNISVEFIRDALLCVSRRIVVIAFGNLPHMCIYRDSLSLIQ